MTLPREANQNFDTRVFLPNWWVRAYDHALEFGLDHRMGTADLLAAGLAPYLGTAELNAIAAILPSFHGQLLVNDMKSVVISPSKILAESQLAPNNRRAAIERVLSCLSGLRVLENMGGSIQSQRIFEKERWLETDEGWDLYLDFSDIGAELIFGYEDPYFALARGDRAVSAAMAHPPLSLWKSVWLDLQGSEQGLLLQLEKRMQWSNAWLHLEGVFESNLDELFSGFRIPGSRRPVSEFAGRLKILEKLGRKLVDHGFLSSASEGRFLAFEADSTRGFHLGWQIARERLLGDEFWAFGLGVANSFARRSLSGDRNEWLNIIASGLAVSRIRQVSDQVFPELINIINDISDSPLFVGDAGIVSYPQLFVEWFVRLHPGHPIPLPHDLKVSEAGKLASPRHKLSIAERFKRFVAEVASHPSYQIALNQAKFATLTAAVTRQCSEVSEWLEKASGLGDKLFAGGTMYVEEAKPQLVFSRGDDAVDSDSLPPDNSGINQKTGETASRIRRIAMEELIRIKSTAPDRYADLKKMYLESLEDGERKLIMDVMRRLKSSVFEDHLKPHLIRYMIENPSSWGMASTPSQSLPT